MRSPRKSRQISIPSRSLLPRGNLQFNHLLVKDDEPLLFHPKARPPGGRGSWDWLRGLLARVGREARPKIPLLRNETWDIHIGGLDDRRGREFLTDVLLRIPTI